MPMNRREYLLAGAAAAVSVSMGCASTGHKSAKAESRKQAALKLSSQEWIIPGKSFAEKVALMESWGFEGVELGGGDLSKRINEVKDGLKGHEVQVSAICAGFKGVPISEKPEVRQQFLASAGEIVKAAGELGSTGLIMVPAFNGQTTLGHVEGRKILCEEILPKLGDTAEAAGTRVILEPLNRKETWYLRMLADAASICRDVNHPAVCMMGDFYHMYFEETDDRAAFLSAKDYLHHVHLACIVRNLPGQDPRDYRNGFRGLKEIGYTDYCSLECGVAGDRMVEIPKSVEFLRQQWREA